jgi:hypothetical protein
MKKAQLSKEEARLSMEGPTIFGGGKTIYGDGHVVWGRPNWIYTCLYYVLGGGEASYRTICWIRLLTKRTPWAQQNTKVQS